MRRIMWVALATLVAVLILPSVGHAAIRVTCFDGNAQAVVKVPGHPPGPSNGFVTCDTTVDGTCTFLVERGGCLCAPKGCCGFDEFTVPVRRQRAVRRKLSRPKLILRCRPCPVPPPFPPNAICPVAP